MSGKSTPILSNKKKSRKSRTFNPGDIKMMRIKGLLGTDDESSSISPLIKHVNPGLEKALKEKSKIYHEKKKLRISVSKITKALPRNDSSNHVYVVGDTFLKISGTGEKLMYDFTTFIQQNRNPNHEKEIAINVPIFAPTGLIDLKTLNNSDEKSKFKTTRESVGSFQPTIKGLSLKELLLLINYQFFLNMDPNYETKLAFIILYTVVLGQYDLHSNNIIVDIKITNNNVLYDIRDLDIKNGMIVDKTNNVLQACKVDVTFTMFDLMRSLAHSQDVIIWGSMLTVACRCALFRLESSYNKMSKRTLMLLEAEVINLMVRGDKIANDFLKRDEIKKLVDGLPKGYFYDDYIISGYMNRCKTILKSIRQEKLINPCDIIFKVHKNYKFFAMIAIIVRYMSQQEIVDNLCSDNSSKENTEKNMGTEEIKQLWYHGLSLAAAPSVGNENISLEDRMEICYNLGISPRQLMAICIRDDFSYIETIRKIKSEIWFKATINKIMEDLDTIYKKYNDLNNLEIKNFLKNVCLLFNNIKIKLNKLDKESVTYKHVWIHVIPHIDIFTNAIEHYEECINLINEIDKNPTNKRLDKLLYYSLEDYGFYNDINKVIDIYNEKKIGLNDDLQKILIDLHKAAIPDFKDIPSDSIMKICNNYIDNTFNLFGLEISEDVKSLKTPAIEKYNNVLEINGEVLPGYYMKIKKDKYVKLDYSTKPGFIIYKKREMTVPFFIEWFKSQCR